MVDGHSCLYKKNPYKVICFLTACRQMEPVTKVCNHYEAGFLPQVCKHHEAQLLSQVYKHHEAQLLSPVYKHHEAQLLIPSEVHHFLEQWEMARKETLRIRNVEMCLTQHTAAVAEQWLPHLPAVHVFKFLTKVGIFKKFNPV